MNQQCDGGVFNGNDLTTDRDIQLCVEGGGRPDGVEPQQPAATCGVPFIVAFGQETGRDVPVGSLSNVSRLFREASEVAVLRCLSSAAAPNIAGILPENPELGARMVDAVDRLNALAEPLLSDREFSYSAEDHEFFSGLAREVVEGSRDEEFSALAEQAIELSDGLVGMSGPETIERLGGLPHLDVTGDQTSLDVALPDWVTETLDADRPPLLPVTDVPAAARRAIDEKAKSLGAVAFIALGRMRRVAGGYVRRYHGCDIYWSGSTGAHEVHGEIRRKYDALEGPRALGLPTTDEAGTPDGRGRFNHLHKNASIYWTPTTGPFSVAGAVRFRWASEGWETGPVGYPVTDERSVGTSTSDADRGVRWRRFENGIICGKGGAAQQALAATVGRDRIVAEFSRRLNAQMRERDIDLGPFSITVRPGLNNVLPLGVDDWRPDFWSARPRILRIGINGFVGIPAALLVPDPTFHIRMGLSFSCRWPTDLFSHPQAVTLVATLEDLRIVAEGVSSGNVFEAVNGAIAAAFRPPSDRPYLTDASMVLADIPTGAVDGPDDADIDFLDVMLMADGSLSVFVNLLPPVAGRLRRYFAQKKIDTMFADS